jgi:hypothetical protein
MRRDFERLAKERLHRVVKDLIQLYEIAELSHVDAARGISFALFRAGASVLAWGKTDPTRDELYLLVDSLLRSARRTMEHYEKKEAKQCSE